MGGVVRRTESDDAAARPQGRDVLLQPPQAGGDARQQGDGRPIPAGEVVVDGERRFGEPAFDVGVGEAHLGQRAQGHQQAGPLQAIDGLVRVAGQAQGTATNLPQPARIGVALQADARHLGRRVGVAVVEPTHRPGNELIRPREHRPRPPRPIQPARDGRGHVRALRPSNPRPSAREWSR